MNIQALDLSVDLLQVLLWQYNDAARLQSLLTAKQAWYDANQSGFWSDWTVDVFDLSTANDFGLAVWARILGLPLVIQSDPDPSTKLVWGFGAFREGFTQGNFASTNTTGGLTTEQKRLALQLRYFQLVTRGAVPEVNAFLRGVFGTIGGAPLAAGTYPQYSAASLSTALRVGPATVVGPSGFVGNAPANTARIAYSAPAPNIIQSSNDLRNAAEGNAGSPWSQFVDADTSVALVPVANRYSVQTSKLQCATVGAQQRQVSQPWAALDNSVWCVSADVLAAEVPALSYTMSRKDGTFPTFTFNAATGAQISQTGAGWVASGVKPVDAFGFRRVWIAINVGAGAGIAAVNIQLKTLANANYSGAIGDGALIAAVKAEPYNGVGPTDYQPQPLGLLVENAATNLLRSSRNIADGVGGWVIGASLGGFFTPALDALAGPDGVAAADGRVVKFTSVAGASVLFMRQTLSAVTAAGAYSPSLWVYVPTQTGVTGWRLTNDLQDTDTSGAMADQTLFDQWVRVSPPGLVATGARTWLDFNVFTQGGATPPAGFVFYVFGPQFEPGAVTSSYVPSGLSPTTRGADGMRLPDANSVGKVYAVDSGKMAINYVFPPNLLTSAVESVLTDLDLLPRPAGVRVGLVIQGDADGWGFGRYHENYSNGNFYS